MLDNRQKTHIDLAEKKEKKENSRWQELCVEAEYIVHNFHIFHMERTTKNYQQLVFLSKKQTTNEQRDTKKSYVINITM